MLRVLELKFGKQVIDNIEIGVVGKERFSNLTYTFKYKVVKRDSIKELLQFYKGKSKKLSVIVVSNLMEHKYFIKELTDNYKFKSLNTVNSVLQFETLLGKPVVRQKNLLRKPKWK